MSMTSSLVLLEMSAHAAMFGGFGKAFGNCHRGGVMDERSHFLRNRESTIVKGKRSTCRAYVAALQPIKLARGGARAE